MPTYVVGRTASGAETVTDQLAGTPVAFAGPSGLVEAAFVATLFTTEAVLRGRESGIEVIPSGSAATIPGAVTALRLTRDDFLYAGRVKPGEPLELAITHAAAGTALVAIRTS